MVSQFGHWYLQVIKPCTSSEVQGFFWLYYGWVLGIDYLEVNPMTIDYHTVGYLVIALVYIAFVFMK